MMPSRYSSQGSIDDSKDLAKRLGLGRCEEAPITSLHQAMQQALASPLGERGASGVIDENVQARLRGILLMAMSNAIPRSLVLATCNKSEIATGYSTLYGDMCGAVAVLGDLTKTRVYELARWINRHFADCGFTTAPIPERSILKPPSAELRPDQTDQDTLPPYDVLDEIIERHIEAEQSARTIADETSLDEALVCETIRMIDRAQYKRDQAPVVLKLTQRSFGRGRPMPIVSRTQGLTMLNQRGLPAGQHAPAAPSADGEKVVGPVSTRGAKISSVKR
jgi:NAD+ synthase (glutamine-hydrolysing)